MSADSSKSYLSVAYDLRPAKQVERRILLDFFRRLAGCGVPVESFRYTGMGSIHFIDHVLFHKYLGITKLVSVERDEDIKKRVKFNRPFKNVDIEIMEIGDYVPCLNADERHIVWLDYDYRLSRDMIEDVRSCANHLSIGSFILVTVDVEPSRQSKGNSDNYEYYKEVAGLLWKQSWSASDFANSELHLRALDILALAFREGISGRTGIDALPCFKFVYADGHKMATLGVHIGGALQMCNLKRVKESGAEYLVIDFDGDPFNIDVPVLTRRERLYLERLMPSHDNVAGKPIGIGEEDIERFSKVYQFLPSYAELMIG
ncbi:MAG: hypothetical protein OXI64_04055 [Defluviicoccus sp.]|nr:hypothetical protein [Defluviicoccus sp.]